MSGIAFFTLSVGLIGLQLNLGRNASSSGPMDFLSRMNLALYAYGLIVLGSFLILSGCLIEVAIPAVRWCVSWRGRLYRTLARKIEEGLAARNPEISLDEQKQWASASHGDIYLADVPGHAVHKYVRRPA